ncbi:MAG TPA: nucleotide disphospho-sugar-binding domain-containing protein [Oscillatoriaceae cyanobacterium]
MASYLWLTWDGAGNLPPSLAIARELTQRGHTVTFAGRPEMLPRAQAAGFATVAIANSYTQAERYPATPIGALACYLTSPAVQEELVRLVDAQAPDAVVIDGMFPAALAEAPGFGRPTVMTCYTFFHRGYEAWRAQLGRLVGLREKAGLGALPAIDALWRMPQRIVVTTPAEFDRPLAADAPTTTHHVGPVLDGHASAISAKTPVARTSWVPLALISFSTASMQNSVATFQKSLDALAGLPLRVVATTAGTIDAAALRVPENASVVGYADHDALLAEAALVVTHGGHGTAMRALRHGVPAIVMPSVAHDQPIVGATLEEWGCGLMLPSDADVDTIRAAAETILGTPSFGQSARERAGVLASMPGTRGAADVFEAVLPVGC